MEEASGRDVESRKQCLVAFRKSGSLARAPRVEFECVKDGSDREPPGGAPAPPTPGRGRRPPALRRADTGSPAVSSTRTDPGQDRSDAGAAECTQSRER